MSDDLREAVESGDLDRLTRLIDGLCAAREWARVVELRDRCRHALERGLQLWPAAEYAEYRLALEAPGPYAGPVVTETAGRFALGPLWEVSASTHQWGDLGAHLPPGPARALAAHERVLRGEDLSGDDSIDPFVLELPLRLEAWEPAYPVATYRSSEAEFPSPPPASLGPVTLPAPGAERSDPLAVEALRDLAAPWSEQSNGTVGACAVAGTAEEAISALTEETVALTDVEPAAAIAHVAWAGASGGAYGRRRGSPMGRFAAWWLVAALADVEWPPEPGEIGEAAASMRWLMWSPASVTHGWSACIAVERGDDAWALYAVDDHREEDALSD